MTEPTSLFDPEPITINGRNYRRTHTGQWQHQTSGHWYPLNTALMHRHMTALLDHIQDNQ